MLTQCRFCGSSNIRENSIVKESGRTVYFCKDCGRYPTDMTGGKCIECGTSIEGRKSKKFCDVCLGKKYRGLYVNGKRVRTKYAKPKQKPVKIKQPCPFCGSDHTYGHGFTGDLRLYRCMNCSKFFKEAKGGDDGKIVCVECGESKPLDRFTKNSRTCKNCKHPDRQHIVFDEHISIPTTKQVRTRKNSPNPEKVLKARLSKYGLNFIKYKQMLVDQDNTCLICKRNLSELKRHCIDHDHETGKVRGILCYNCNGILGLAHDDINILQEAINYLR